MVQVQVPYKIGDDAVDGAREDAVAHRKARRRMRSNSCLYFHSYAMLGIAIGGAKRMDGLS